ncbi:MAG TPA: macrolide ABC transporter ATP-binding protein [Anaerolineaceae bacterium]|jgi:putative ABC transport system ATP-binding protein|nr:macrolide ABC transporter ATP-binding protein [Anaerolineaceae bacterium]
MSFIETRALSKYFQMGSVTVKALDNVNLKIDQRSISTIMGPSGSGKSTLLHLLGGLDRPTDGMIRVNGNVLNDLDENDLAFFRRETVGFVFQAFNLLQSLTALENVSFPMRFLNMPHKVRNERALDLLDQVGIADRADHKPAELSGGEQQRVAIARALVNDPMMILADEPTGNLDSVSGWAIMEILAGLNKLGKTIVVVTHDPRMTQFTNHVLYILDGDLVSEDVYQEAIQVNG